MGVPSALALADPSAPVRSPWVTGVLVLAAAVAVVGLRPLAAVLWERRGLVRSFVVRDLKVRYVGSSIGFFWSVIAPVINLCVFFFVFRMILGARWGDTTPPQQAALYMVVGILAWTAFSESVIRATSCLVENANLIKKVVFPSEVFPVYLTLSSLVNMFIGVPVAVVAVALVSTDAGGGTFELDLSRLGWPLLFLPVLALLQGLFTAGLGYLLATVNVFLRDVHQVVGVGMMVWMFGTPIFYPDVLVIEKGFGWLIEPNPMYWLVEAYRDVILEKSLPEPVLVVRFAAVSLITLALGARTFRSQRRTFPDLL